MARDYTRWKHQDRRLKKLRENGRRQGKVPVAMIVHRISPEIRQVLGPHFMLLEEGSGLFGHKFGHVFAAVSPTTPKMNFWWREVAARTDGGAINFL